MNDPMVIMESFDDRRDHSSYRFAGLLEVISATAAEQVVPALARVEAMVSAGRHAAGFISYEAAQAFNPDLTTAPQGRLPLLWFGIFEKRLAVTHPPTGEGGGFGPYRTFDWQTSLAAEDYIRRAERIRELIAAGDTYQVNLTMRRRFRFDGDHYAFYRDLCRSQRAPFCAFLEVERFRVLSASPELFFRLHRGELTTRPMKGTAPRGRWFEDDEAVKQRLVDDPKERAENLMIVDMLRNDLGMVSETGSVKVRSLFDIETLETVHQMTSTISSRIREGVGIVDLFRALFPCGSVTGAPKRRTMEIIAELEDSPRGVYTGCIGFISPGGEAVFSVAIRTIVIDSLTGEAEMGIGSGVTYSSNARDEYEECLAKGRFALEQRPDFQLVETMLYEEGDGYYLLERHLERLRRSALYFGYRLNPEPIRRALQARTSLLKGKHRARLLLSRRGQFTIQIEPLVEDRPESTLKAVLAEKRIDSRDPFLFNKTTHRPLYASEPARHPDCVDLLFLNERGEVTEGSLHNIVARLGGEWVTPPIESGLLAGVYREELLARGEVRERTITANELRSAEEIHLVNSVRRRRKIALEN